MKIIAAFLLLNLAAASGAQQVKYAPADGALAVPLSTDNSYFRSPAHPAYDYWNLSSFYAAQKNDYSCTSASAAMALNALLNSRRQRGDQDENIAEAGLTEKISKLKWRELTSEAGLDGRHGLTLAQLAAGLREAAAAYGAAGAAVTAVEVSSRTGLALENFRKALSSNERDPRDVMLLHFAQDALTGAPGGPYPHVSPVGAYDEKTRRVLVLDVDRRWYEPYWAADVQVFKAMAVKTKNFGHGGYAVIKAAR